MSDTKQDFKEVKQAFTEVWQELKRLKWTLLVATSLTFLVLLGGMVAMIVKLQGLA